MHVIGTAGHVDHGKSTLIEALTGIHPDRLKEEREREMTIDLGFGWLILESGEEIGIIDVPGHRDFIENMLAGVGSIDAALFVISADEGVMPQTKEHLTILDTLQIPAGVVALTKIDLVDAEWLSLVQEEIQDLLSDTVLKHAKIIPVSARTKQGIPELIKEIIDCLASTPPRPDLKRPRLPVDRIFTIAGFGTIVTGTLIDGQFQVGDEIELLPDSLHGRIRGLQTHRHKETVAFPGSRTAINISGIPMEKIERGAIVTHPGDYTSTRRLDVRFKLHRTISQPLRHNTSVKLFIGTDEIIARVRVLGEEEIKPGREGWLQLELREPTVAVRGDHYILRRPSPGETLGGGIIIDPNPIKRHKRFSDENISRLKSLARGNPGDILIQNLNSLGISQLKDVIIRSNIDQKITQEITSELTSSGLLLSLENPYSFDLPEAKIYNPSPTDYVLSNAYWQKIHTQVLHEVATYHRTFPLRTGIPREELKSRLKTINQPSPRIFNLVISRLVQTGELVESGTFIRLAEHAIHYSPEQQRFIEALMNRFNSAPYTPPSVKECIHMVGSEIYSALLETKRLIEVSPEVVFTTEDYNQMVEVIKKMMEKTERVTAAQARDQFNTSRKYALAFLEYLDSIGLTIRDGDYHRLRS